MAAVVAVPFGLVALRVRRHTFVVVTIAVFFIFQLMAFNLAFTGGSIGINAPFLGWDSGHLQQPFYYLALVIAVGHDRAFLADPRSRFGLQLRAIRDDEDRARGLGRAGHAGQADRLHDLRGRHRAWSAGSGSSSSARSCRSSGSTRCFDLSVALMAFLGGLGTVAGPVLGALILEPAQQYLTLHDR